MEKQKFRIEQVESVVFDSDKYALADVKGWIEKHGYKYSKPDVTENKIRVRQQDPAKFARFRTIKIGDGVELVLGFVGVEKLVEAKKSTPKKSTKHKFADYTKKSKIKLEIKVTEGEYPSGKKNWRISTNKDNVIRVYSQFHFPNKQDAIKRFKETHGLEGGFVPPNSAKAKTLIAKPIKKKKVAVKKSKAAETNKVGRKSFYDDPLDKLVTFKVTAAERDAVKKVGKAYKGGASEAFRKFFGLKVF